MQPIVLGPNMPDTFYRGAGRIDRLRGRGPGRNATYPEDWVASTASLFGRATDGMTRLGDGMLLADVIAADPVAWLGREHVARYGAEVFTGGGSQDQLDMPWASRAWREDGWARNDEVGRILPGRFQAALRSAGTEDAVRLNRRRQPDIAGLSDWDSVEAWLSLPLIARRSRVSAGQS